MAQRGALSDYVDNLQAEGRLAFTRDEAMDTLGVTASALKQAAWRLSKRGRIVSPRRGFYIIVPLEYRSLGAPPLQSWLPVLLRFHGVRGGEVTVEDGRAAVVVDRALRPLRCGPWEVRFCVRKACD